MIVFRAQLFLATITLAITHHHTVQSVTVEDLFKPKTNPDISETDLLAIIRVPRDTSRHQTKDLPSYVSDEASGRRTARDSNKYYTEKYSNTNYKDGEREDRSLKPEDHVEDDRSTKSSATLDKRCTTCDTDYSRGPSSRSRYDRYDRDPYSSSGRSRYDPYDRYDRDRYYDRYDMRLYDDYDRDGYRDYRGRNKYSTSSYFDRYDPRDRYYDRGLGYDNRGYDYRERDYYSPYSRDRYEAYSPYDDYYSGGYDSYSSRGSYGRPETYRSGGGYARGYSYGDRDRYGGYGSGYGGGGGGGGYGASSGYGATYGASRSKYPAYDFDSGYRHTSYLYGRPSSSTTTDIPKSSDGEQSKTSSPLGSNSSG